MNSVLVSSSNIYIFVEICITLMNSYKFKSITKKYLSQIGISNFYQDLVFQWIIIIYVFYSFMAYSIEIYSYTTIYSNPGAFTSWVSNT